jgi:hypothetical protein
MRKIGLLLGMILMVSVNLFAQKEVDTDAKCISLMKVPLEGPDSVFIPALEEVGFVQQHPEDPEPDTYYFTGDFYGIKSNLEVCVDEKTKLLTDVTVTCGPYRTFDLFDRNRKYLIGKLQREWGNFSAKGDGSLYLLNDYGYIQQSQLTDGQGSRTIRYFYLNSSPYYKDASNMGLKGQVQEVITQNPVMEEEILHFETTGRLVAEDLVDRKYNKHGYLMSASMLEPDGGKSLLTYEYDSDGCLVKRTLVNPTTGIRSVTDYRYNTDFEITQQSYKAFNKENECVISYTMKNDLSERDDENNWTANKAQFTYWEKDQRTQIIGVNQTRVISYWE